MKLQKYAKKSFFPSINWGTSKPWQIECSFLPPVFSLEKPLTCRLPAAYRPHYMHALSGGSSLARKVSLSSPPPSFCGVKRHQRNEKREGGSRYSQLLFLGFCAKRVLSQVTTRERKLGCHSGESQFQAKKSETRRFGRQRLLVKGEKVFFPSSLLIWAAFVTPAPFVPLSLSIALRRGGRPGLYLRRPSTAFVCWRQTHQLCWWVSGCQGTQAEAKLLLRPL